jgi:hypothetical protein
MMKAGYLLKTVTVCALMTVVLFISGCGDETLSMRNKSENKQEMSPSANNTNDANDTNNETASDLTALFNKDGRDESKPNASITSAASFTKTVGSSLSCMQMCIDNKDCKAGKAKSFCKWDQLDPACFGLYWRDATRKSTCYFPADSSCVEKYPVGCGVLKPIAMGRTVEAIDFLGSNKSCQGLCTLVRGCVSSACSEDRSKSGYCSGLYWLSDTALTQGSVAHDSVSDASSLKDNQRVACGVYNYTSELL